jgi:phage terminase large subunit-like protein
MVKEIIAVSILSFLGGAIVVSFANEQVQREKDRHQGNEIHFIWNDDEESIPAEGAMVKIEGINENTVYLAPLTSTDSIVTKELDKINIQY